MARKKIRSAGPGLLMLLLLLAGCFDSEPEERPASFLPWSGTQGELLAASGSVYCPGGYTPLPCRAVWDYVFDDGAWVRMQGLSSETASCDGLAAAMAKLHTSLRLPGLQPCVSWSRLQIAAGRLNATLWNGERPLLQEAPPANYTWSNMAPEPHSLESSFWLRGAATPQVQYGNSPGAQPGEPSAAHQQAVDRLGALSTQLWREAWPSAA